MDKAANVVSLCAAIPHRTVLEVGAGEGSVFKGLSELDFGEELYALEISPTGIETIKNKKTAQLAECRLFDGYEIPHANKKFDLVILSHMLEHVEHPSKLQAFL